MSLNPPVSDSDHTRGPSDAPIALVQYGDFECPYSGAAFDAVREVQEEFGGQLRYTFRHFPLYDIHPHAMQASLAAEAAAKQGQFWPMYDLLFESQHALRDADLKLYAEQLNLDPQQFAQDVQNSTARDTIQKSIDAAKQMGVHGTPTFFVNGQMHDNREGLWDADALIEAIRSTIQR